MPSPTNNEIRQTYVDVINAIWQGNVGYAVRVDLIDANVEAVVDNTLEKIRTCSALLATMEGAIWLIFYPTQGVNKTLRKIVELLCDHHSALQDGGNYSADISTWMSALNNSYAVCRNTAAGTNRSALATALLWADLGM